ncbi:hypothetical protein FIBSPDRAFT_858834 [Athelia psychrophila]|uniref:Uncharacterized protein n=1 Tax=Athelia psychrophila TaxID=1759441 RepID=A0A166LPV9_9AGAM|nr:hypothetical protein FIBSPDRAFT_858834 [Fibularhizoctonia sp. CBS 109695]
MPATTISRFFSSSEEDGVREQECGVKGGDEREEGRREAVHIAPIIQRLVTPIRLHRRRHLHSLRKRRIEHQKEQKMELDAHIAKRVSGDKAKLAAVKASQKPSPHKSGS